MQMSEAAQGAGVGSGVVVEVRDVVGGHLASSALVGSDRVVVFCVCPRLAGYVHCGRGNLSFRCAVGGRLGAPFLFARGLSSGRCGCKGRANPWD